MKEDVRFPPRLSRVKHPCGKSQTQAGSSGPRLRESKTGGVSDMETIIAVTNTEGSDAGKKCSKCGLLKPLSEFSKNRSQNDGYSSRCKECRKKDRRQYYVDHREQDNKRSQIWSSAHREQHNKSKRLYYRAHKEQDNERSRAWKAAHPEKMKEYVRRSCSKRYSTPKGKLNIAMTGNIRRSLKEGAKAGHHWETLVCFTVDELKCHLEKLFTPEMSWVNYGSYWHIDHEIPIAAFNFETPEDMDFKRCWGLKNLQPLEAKKNMGKGAKLDRPFQPSLSLTI